MISKTCVHGNYFLGQRILAMCNVLLPWMTGYLYQWFNASQLIDIELRTSQDSAELDPSLCLVAWLRTCFVQSWNS